MPNTTAAALACLESFTDAEIGRLLAAIRAEDPGLQSVLVTVVADHGEELGEEGRTGHTSLLSEAVHHVPFILAGAGVRPRQRFDALSANIDVTPTILSILGLTAPATSRFDGRSLLTGTALCAARAAGVPCTMPG